MEPAGAPSAMMYTNAPPMAALMMLPGRTLPESTFPGPFPGNKYPHYSANDEAQPDRNEVFNVKGKRK